MSIPDNCTTPVADHNEALKHLQFDLWSFSRDMEVFAWAGEQLHCYSFSLNHKEGNLKLVEFGSAVISLSSLKCRELSDRLEELLRPSSMGSIRKSSFNEEFGDQVARANLPKEGE